MRFKSLFTSVCDDARHTQAFSLRCHCWPHSTRLAVATANTDTATSLPFVPLTSSCQFVFISACGRWFALQRVLASAKPSSDCIPTPVHYLFHTKECHSALSLLNSSRLCCYTYPSSSSTLLSNVTPLSLRVVCVRYTCVSISGLPHEDALRARPHIQGGRGQLHCR